MNAEELISFEQYLSSEVDFFEKLIRAYNSLVFAFDFGIVHGRYSASKEVLGMLRSYIKETGKHAAAPDIIGSPKLIVTLKKWFKLYSETEDGADYDNAVGAGSFVEFIDNQLSGGA